MAISSDLLHIWFWLVFSASSGWMALFPVGPTSNEGGSGYFLALCVNISKTGKRYDQMVISPQRLIYDLLMTNRSCIFTFDWPWMTLNGYRFEFSPKLALSNFKHIRQVAAQVRLLLLDELLTHSLGGSAVARNPCVSWTLLFFYNGSRFKRYRPTIRHVCWLVGSFVSSSFTLAEISRKLEVQTIFMKFGKMFSIGENVTSDRSRSPTVQGHLLRVRSSRHGGTKCQHPPASEHKT